MNPWSEHQDRPDDDCLPSTAVCARCSGINLDNLRNGQKYHHSSLVDISISATSCGLCELIHRTCFRPWWSEEPSRYQCYIHLSGVIRQGDRSEYHGPYEICADLQISVFDITPWLDDVPYAKVTLDGRMKYVPDESGHVLVLGRPLECFTVKGDPAADLGIRSARPLGENTSSKESFDTARGWLSRCLTETRVGVASKHPARADLTMYSHTRRARSEADMHVDTSIEALRIETPRRLVYLQPDGLGSCHAKLVPTQDLTLQYTTLSYCWGTLNDRAWLTTKENLSDRTTAFDANSMPKTVRDSFVIAAELGFRYIWIDALCIVQDDGQEWTEESAKMAGIYRGSMVTIAVPSSYSVNDGCFNTSSRSHFDKFVRLIGLKSTLNSGESSSIFVYDFARPNIYSREVWHGPWARRGWTYQEQMFARRVVYFSDSQLFWHCEHCQLSEDGLNNNSGYESNTLSPTLPFNRPLKRYELLEWWYVDVVSEYSSRALTFGSDKLVALSALAKATYLTKRVEYLAGIWRDSVLTGLLWQRSGKGGKAREYRCPAWSWLSQDSKVSYGLAEGKWSPGEPARAKIHGDVQSECLDKDKSMQAYGIYDMRAVEVGFGICPDGPYARILSASTEQDPTNPFGAVRGGFIAIETRIVAALRTTDQPARSWRADDSDAQALLFASCSQNGDEGFACMDNNESEVEDADGDQETAYIDSDESEWEDSGRVQGIAYMDDDDSGAEDVVCALLIATYQHFIFLLLEQVEPATNTYKRIGIATAGRSELDVMDMELTTIRII